MSKHFNRRDLLRYSFMTPLSLYLTQKLTGFMSVADLLASDVMNEAFLDYKMIHISMSGGPARWYWDLPLMPNGASDNLVSNPMCISRFKNGSTIAGEYGVTKIDDYYLPYLWNSKIATPNGGEALMKELAHNALMLRGIDLQIDSHDIDREKQMIPVAGSSLMGLVADYAKTPIPGAGMSSANFFISKKGVTYVDMNSNSPFETALNPFLGGGNLESLKTKNVEDSIEATLSLMQTASKEKHFYLPSTFQNRLNAKKLMKKEFGNLRDAYNSLQQKYENLITRSFGDESLRLDHVDNKVVQGSDEGKFNIYGPDGSKKYNYTGSDLRTLTNSSTSISNLSKSMAIMEFMIKEGYSSSTSSVIGGWNNVKLDEIRSNSGEVRSNYTRGVGLDTHEVGAYTGLVLYSRYYRAMSSCLYELKNQLSLVNTGSGNLFDRTAVVVSGDFNRSARSNGTGADHGWQGSSYTIFSGMISKLTVLGNITNHSSSGTWGLAGGMSELNGRAAIIGNASSSLCAMLDIKSPTPNDMSYVYKNNGKIYPSVGRPKNV